MLNEEGPGSPRWHATTGIETPRARPMLLTLLGEYVLPHGEPVWTRSFVRALEAFGISAGTARQALKRSAAGGWLRAERVGRETRWHVTPRMHETLADGAERIYGFGQGRRASASEWLLLQVSVPEARRHARAALRTRLAWLGFGSLGQGLWICAEPSREESARRFLGELDLLERAVLFRGQPAAGTELASLVARVWDLEALDHEYRSFLESFRRVDASTERASFRSLSTLVHRWRSFPYLDPQLPAGLLPKHWPGRRATTRFHSLRDRLTPKAQSYWASLV